jgi:serine/threonine protein kinase
MYGCASSQNCYEVCKLSSTRLEHVYAAQHQAPLQSLNSSPHFEFSSTDILPFIFVKKLGVGGQAGVDEVNYVSKGYNCARKEWEVAATIPQGKERARAQLFREVAILEKLRQEDHVIEILATYTQGLVLGLLHLPIGQCDLNVLLGKPASCRREQISDPDLERGFGCLSTALQHMHQEGIRHKDIKPHNILVHGTSLVFTDFGLSRDFSELSSSLTNENAVGTHNYYAPEVAAGKPRGCAADVFSLGCVLLEIWSVLFGLAPLDQDSFPSMKPYYQHLAGVQNWIENKKPSSGNSPLREFWLQACQLMVALRPSQRPRMSNVLLRLKDLAEKKPFFQASCCGVCLEKHANLSEAKLDELRNTDFIWHSDVNVLLDQDHPTAILPNSNQNLTNSKGTVNMYFAEYFAKLGIFAYQQVFPSSCSLLLAS